MKGELLAIVAAILWGIAPLFDKMAIVNSNVSPVLANLIRSVGAFSILILIALIMKDFNLSAFTPQRITFLLTAGSIAGGVAMIIFYLALRQIGASKTVPLSSIYPLFTVILSAIFLGEAVTPKVLIGAALIVAGVVLVMTG